VKQEWGCHEARKFPIFEIDGEKYYQCPKKLISIESIHYLRSFTHYLNGFLLYPGGIKDQANKYLQAMELLLQLKGKDGKKQIEEEKRRLKHASRIKA